ncbi:hypothetical protein VTN02DRAFT_4090 [Thermoascus thermophilus]
MNEAQRPGTPEKSASGSAATTDSAIRSDGLSVGLSVSSRAMIGWSDATLAAEGARQIITQRARRTIRGSRSGSACR